MKNILERIKKLPVKQRYPVFFVFGFLALVAVYIVDVWLIGTIAAHVTAIFLGDAGKNVLTGWYLQHPFSVAMAWLHPTISNPEVRKIWLLLNLVVAFVTAVSIIRDRFFINYADHRDINKIRFKKVNFALSKKLLKTAKDKYFLGLNDRRRHVTLPSSKITEHIHILGGSGSGKTSFAVIPLCVQAIRKGNALISIDFKGDKQAIQLLAREAKAAGKDFYLFSLNSSVKSNTYNPLLSGSVLSKVERIMTALELIYTGSAKFYSYVQQSTFIPLLKSLEDNDVNYTFANIYLLLNNPELLAELTKCDINVSQIKGLTAALVPYAELPQINAPFADIDLQRILEDGHVCYFDLQSAEVPQLSSALGKMIAMDIQALAGQRSQLSPAAVIAIDEFQNMACEAFTNIIAKLRSANIAFILANQAMGDLAAVSGSFLNTIVTNTATKMVFNVEDPQDAEYFARRSGKVLQEVKSQGKSRQKPIIQGFEVLQGIEVLLGNDHNNSFFNSTSSHARHDNVSENKSEIETYLIHPNVILSLPFGKSLVFKRGETVTLSNHTHLITKEEKDRLENAPYPQIESQQDTPQRDKFTELITQKKQELISRSPKNKKKRQDLDYSVFDNDGTGKNNEDESREADEFFI